MRFGHSRVVGTRAPLLTLVLLALMAADSTAVAQDGLTLMYEQSVPPNSVEGFVTCCSGAIGFSDYHLADDFLVSDADWEVSHVLLWGERTPAGGALEISIHSDAEGAPGALLTTTGPTTAYASAPVQHWYGSISDFLVPLPEPLLLTAGRYWLVVRTLYAPFFDSSETADHFNWVGRDARSGSEVLARENDDDVWKGTSLLRDMVFSLYGNACPRSPVSWLTAGNGFFNHPANWSGEEVPGETDTPVFGLGGEIYTVTLSGDLATEGLQVDGDAVQLGSTLFTHTLRGASSCDPVLLVGPTPGSRLDLKDANMLVQGGVLVEGMSSTLHLTNAQLTSNERVYVDGGEEFAGITVWERGSLDARAGIQLSATQGARSALTVRSGGFAALGGIGSSVGEAGRGEFKVEGGGEAIVNSLLLLGEMPGSSGTAIVSGAEARLTVGHAIFVGYEALGRMEVSDGGRPSVPTIVVGLAPTAQGTVRVQGNETRWPDVHTLDIGAAGHGRVEISEGASLGAFRTFIGREPGGIGELLLTTGATFSSVAVDAGTVGAGIIDVSGGGSFEANLLRYGPSLTIELGPVPMQIGRTVRSGKRESHHFQVDSLVAAGEDVVIRAEAVEFGEDAYLAGTGTFAFDVANAGLVSPGDSTGAIGTFKAGADYVQATDGVLELDLSEAGHDQLAVSGSATLAGTVRIRLTSGFAPEVGRSFEILSAAAVSGSFDEVDLPEGLSVELSYAPTHVTATIAAPVATMPGDETSGIYALEPNYPNPFNPTTQIAYELPEAAHVRLLVYDAAGRLVRVVVDGLRAAGRHVDTFSADGLPSGVYYCRLEAPGATLGRPITFMK